MLNGKPNGSTPDPGGETELGKLVVENMLATQEQVDQALARRASLYKPGEGPATPEPPSLGDLLVRQGAMTAEQLGRARSVIEASRSQQIPGYRLLGQLGSGAMATVFKARQLKLDRMVAIKVLSKKLSENPEYVDRFYKEGRAAARLNHPNIVQAIDVGEASGYHYFVMEYVDGHTLHDELAEGKVYEEREALRIILQIARALEHAHKLGLIHRDVKPKNIMLTKEGIPKLADMGLARQVTDAQAAQAEAGRAFGTPYYISPEQIRGELNIDFRADIYSLGATLYHLVTGRVPFEGPTPAAVMHKHLKEPLVPPDHLNTSLSAGLGEVVEVMMAKDREKRYRSTGDLLLDLEAIATGTPPLQARKQIDSSVLSGLAAGEDSELSDTQEMGAPAAPAGRLLVWVIVLGGALALSLILNLYYAMK